MKTLTSILMVCILAIAPSSVRVDLILVARVFLAIIRKPIVDERLHQAFAPITEGPVLRSGQPPRRIQ
jgi:hypothetical protein